MGCSRPIVYTSTRTAYRVSQVSRGRASAFERRVDAVLADLAAAALLALTVFAFVRPFID